MASFPVPTPKCLLALAALLALTPAASLQALGNDRWKTTQGESFRGDPAGLLGPLALFRVSPTAGRRVLLSHLSEADCVRYHQQLTERGLARADQWSNAASRISRELLGGVQELKDGRLSDVDVSARVEPELYVIFYATDSIRWSHDMMKLARDKMAETLAKHPGLVESVFFGVRHNDAEHRRMAIELNVPGLVTRLDSQTRMDEIERFAPPTGDWQMVVLHRDGVPVFSAARPLEKEVETIFGQLNGMLDLMHPHTPAGWQDRLHYHKAVQPVAFKSGSSDPLFIADPLNHEQLRQAGIPSFTARLQVAADGQIAKVGILSKASMETGTKQALATGLLKAIFVPAVTDGKFVDGQYTYTFKGVEE